MAKSRKSRKVQTQPKATAIQKDRGYTDEDVIRVLALYNLYHNMSEVSRETGFPLATIQRWIAKERDADPDRPSTRIQYYDQRLKQTQDRLMHTMGFVADEALQQVHKKLPDASAAQAATIYGILFDKQQLMSGNAGGQGNTFHFNLSNLSADDAANLMERVLDRQRQTRAVPVSAQVVDDGNENE